MTKCLIIRNTNHSTGVTPVLGNLGPHAEPLVDHRLRLLELQPPEIQRVSTKERGVFELKDAWRILKIISRI